MKHMTLGEITKACHGTYMGDPSYLGEEVSQVSTDSRQIQKDALFIAIEGERVDGHLFIPDVMEKGALCAISEKALSIDTPYILVDSSLQALKDLAAYYRRCLDIKVIGITGSVGKTSTKEMIASILGQKYNVLKTEGNFNNEIGLPLTILNIREDHDIAVLEMGISQFGEMSRLARMALPDYCVITNIGYAHLENLKSRDGIVRAKSEMFSYMNPEGKIFLNGDDDKLFGLRPENGISPIYFGLSSSCDFRADQIEPLGLQGTSADFITPSSHFAAHIPIPGDHMIYNALAGTAIGYSLGMTDQEIQAGIESAVSLNGRDHLIETDTFTIIDDCYNANPSSMRASLDVLATADTRKVAILGDMFELGEAEKELHQEIGSYAAEKGIDVLICIGTLAREIKKGAESYLSTHPDHPTQLYSYDTNDAFLQEAAALLHSNDTILIKASHAMGFNELVTKLKSY